MGPRFAFAGAAALTASCLLASPPPADAIGLELFGVPSPTDVVKLIDALTRKDSSTSVEVKQGDTMRQGKFLVARTRVEVVMERSSRNWRGPVNVHMTVPTDVTYSLDLSAIRPEHIAVDASRKLLVVALPPLQVEDVTPVLASLKSEDTFKRARFRRFDGDACRELQNTMLKEDYLLRARKEGEARLPAVREKAQAALRDLLQNLLRPGCPDIQVQVE
jgi:hypothetical protein